MLRCTRQVADVDLLNRLPLASRVVYFGRRTNNEKQKNMLKVNHLLCGKECGYQVV